MRTPSQLYRVGLGSSVDGRGRGRHGGTNNIQVAGDAGRGLASEEFEIEPDSESMILPESAYAFRCQSWNDTRAHQQIDP